MTGLDAFLAGTTPRLTKVEIAFHDGDAGPRGGLWSHRDPVTLFGAVVTKTGWAKIARIFGWLASRFSNCGSFQYEVIAAKVRGDLAYIAGIEHITASSRHSKRALRAARDHDLPARGRRVEGRSPPRRPGGRQ